MGYFVTITLNLGVVDIPYGNAYAPRNPRPLRGPISLKSAMLRRARRAQAAASPLSTGDVAEILEDRYHIMESFFELNKADIQTMLDKGLVGVLQNILLGLPAPADPFDTASGKMAKLFRSFLSQQKMDSLGVPGVPTKASLAGVSHRRAHPYAKRGPRPSFIDTGLYQKSFVAWTEIT